MSALPLPPAKTLAPAAQSLGAMIARAHGETADSALSRWAALLYAHLQEGRVYLDLRQPARGLEIDPPDLLLPDDAFWLEAVEPGDTASGLRPLVRCGERLWLARYHDFDSRLRQMLQARRNAPPRKMDERRLQADLRSLFSKAPGALEDRGQWLAAAALADLSFGLVTGGPGTGKTTSLANMLALFLHHCDPTDLPPILLLAPTGKATARLKQSLGSAARRLRERLPPRSSLRSMVDFLDPQSDACRVVTQTLHKALGVRGSRREGQGPFYHDRHRPLNASFVIVDEVSMVDLALMTRLVEAVPDNAPLILAGDAAQLESVEAGSVLPGIATERPELSPDRLTVISARTGIPTGELDAGNLQRADHVRLTCNHRFSAGSRMARLADVVNRGRADEFLELIRAAPDNGDVVWLKLNESGSQQPAGTREIMMSGYGPLREILKQDSLPDPAAAVRAFDKFRVLCAMRQGPDGVERWNERLHKWVTGTPPTGPIRAVMVTVNDPLSGLCNGDTGLVLPSAEGPALFYAGDLATTPAALLPQHEPGWAITIHKSQGSEYDGVAIVLPRTGGNRLLTRRLLYTALTRARKRIILLATERSLREAISLAPSSERGLG